MRFWEYEPKAIKVGDEIVKYMPLLDHANRLAWVLDIIKSKRIFVPHIEKLNDPLEKMLAPTKPEVDEEENTELGSSAGTEALEKLLKEYDDLRHNCVLSFSKKQHVKGLMWAHYASNWNGVRLHFEVLENHHIEDVDYIDFADQTSFDPILVKHLNWFYEDECRYVHHEEEAVDLESIGLKLTKIYVGFKVHPHIIDILSKTASEENIQFAKADMVLELVL